VRFTAEKIIVSGSNTSAGRRIAMSASDDALHTLTAQWYNSLTTALSLSPQDFQIAQGDLLVPTSTERLWDMMNQVPSESIAQY
jgi:hypothetical protein